MWEFLGVFSLINMEISIFSIYDLCEGFWKSHRLVKFFYFFST